MSIRSTSLFVLANLSIWREIQDEGTNLIARATCRRLEQERRDKDRNAVMAVQRELAAHHSSYRESDGVVRDPRALEHIANLEHAAELLEAHNAQ